MLDLVKNFLWIPVVLLILYILSKRSKEFPEQEFLDKEVKRNWKRAHRGFEKRLLKNSYNTYDLSNIAIAKDTFFPRDLKELKKNIIESKGRKVKVSGGHYTYNDIGISKDVIIRTIRLNKILGLKNRQITVESGITLDDIDLYLERNNLALHVLPAIPYLTIGGAISTSTHGSYPDKGSLSSAVIDITIVLANGKVKTFTKKDKEFTSIITSLGALGAIYSVTLQCEDLFVVDHKRIRIPFDTFITRFDHYRKDYRYLQAYHYPYKKGNNTTVYLRKKIDKFDKKDIVANRDPKSVRMVDQKVDFGHRVLTKSLEASYYTEMEIGIDIKGFKKAIQDIKDLFQRHKRLYKYDTRYPILIRFTGKDNSLLSMTSGRDTVFFNIFNVASELKSQNLIRFYKEYENLLINKYKGRPHYGKKHDLTEKKMKKIYGKNIDKFKQIRDQLDPKRMFSNSYVNRLFGR
jgi:FAD/FMN-containing dehydrogenase